MLQPHKLGGDARFPGFHHVTSLGLRIGWASVHVQELSVVYNSGKVEIDDRALQAIRIVQTGVELSRLGM